MWGRAQDGRLGLGVGASGATQALPVRVDADTHFGGRRVAQVACGERHSAAVTEDGRLFTWGRNLHGELGRGTDHSASANSLLHGESAAAKPLRPEEGNTASAEALASTSAPRMVTALQHVRVTSVAVGRTHTLALTDDGRVFAFGARTEGTGGIPGNSLKLQSASTDAIVDAQTPALVALPEPVRAIAAGAGFSVFLSASGGRVYTCGADDYGQTGLSGQQAEPKPMRNDSPQMAPRLLKSLRDAGGECTAIAAGQFHAAAVTADGRVCVSLVVELYFDCVTRVLL